MLYLNVENIFLIHKYEGEEVQKYFLNISDEDINTTWHFPQRLVEILLFLLFVFQACWIREKNHQINNWVENMWKGYNQ